MFHILLSLSNCSQVLFFRGTRLYWNLTPTTKNFGFPTAYCVKKKDYLKKACGRLSKSQQAQTKERVRENPRGFKEGSSLLHFFFLSCPAVYACCHTQPSWPIHYSFTAPLPFHHEPCNTRLIFLGTDYQSVSLKLSLDMNMVSSMTFILPKPHLELVFGWLPIL